MSRDREQNDAHKDGSNAERWFPIFLFKRVACVRPSIHGVTVLLPSSGGYAKNIREVGISSTSKLVLARLHL